ncbi:MAG: hypothetical protein ACRENK_16465 [Gemmatimonadaceae bacterium]
MARSKAPYYVAAVAGGVSTIVGGALIAEAWSGDAPKKSAIPVGIGFLLIGAVLAYEGTRR